jgi:hypothetical protein
MTNEELKEEVDKLIAMLDRMILELELKNATKH